MQEQLFQNFSKKYQPRTGHPNSITMSCIVQEIDPIKTANTIINSGATYTTSFAPIYNKIIFLDDIFQPLDLYVKQHQILISMFQQAGYAFLGHHNTLIDAEIKFHLLALPLLEKINRLEQSSGKL